MPYWGDSMSRKLPVCEHGKICSQVLSYACSMGAPGATIASRVLPP